MPSGRFGHRDTPSVEVMRAKVNIGLGLDFENEIIPSCRHFHPLVRALKSDEDEALQKNGGRKNGPIFGATYIIPSKGVGQFPTPPFFDDRGLLVPKILTQADVRDNSVLEVVQLVAGAAASEQAAIPAKHGRDSLSTVL